MAQRIVAVRKFFSRAVYSNGQSKHKKEETDLRVTERQRLGAKLDPALRDFVDRVIVPALVREYIAEHGTPNQLAHPARAVRQFEPKKRLSAEGIQ
jgi:hypothetical protein